MRGNFLDHFLRFNIGKFRGNVPLEYDFNLKKGRFSISARSKRLYTLKDSSDRNQPRLWRIIINYRDLWLIYLNVLSGIISWLISRAFQLTALFHLWGRIIFKWNINSRISWTQPSTRIYFNFVAAHLKESIKDEKINVKKDFLLSSNQLGVHYFVVKHVLRETPTIDFLRYAQPLKKTFWFQKKKSTPFSFFLLLSTR